MATIELLTTTISQYLARHPQAEDDIEGIADTWLAPFQFRIDRRMLLEAIDRLEKSAVLSRRTRTDGRTVYARRRDRP